jgi:hypothetical protein
MAAQFAGIAIQNIAAEFQPQWGSIVRKLRINKIIPSGGCRGTKSKPRGSVSYVRDGPSEA